MSLLFRKTKGFTLGELMTGLAVALILTATTVPTYTAVVHRSEISSTVNAFVGELQFARSEALKRGSTVSLCPTVDGSSCSTVASPWSPSVSSGYLVFVDANGNGAIEAGEALLKRFSNNFDAVSIAVINPAPDPKFFAFSRKGLLTSTEAALQFGVDDIAERCMTLSLTGRSTLSSGGCP
jgi:type IV fimbrial biogenesis protein FimT